MLFKINIHNSSRIILLVIVVSILSCGRNEKLTPEARAHYEIPRAALQEKSVAFDILALLMGEYQENIGFVGEIYVRAKIKNNTKYTFEQPVSLFLVAKDYKVIENEMGNRWPNYGIMLMHPSIISPTWQPGDTIVVTGKFDLSLEGLEDDEWEFLEYLTKTLKLPANEPVIIDKYVTAFYGMAGLSPLDCYRKNCPYKKLQKDDPLYCGQRN